MTHFLDQTSDRMALAADALEARLAANITIVRRVFAPSMARLFVVEGAGFARDGVGPTLQLAVSRFLRHNGL